MSNLATTASIFTIYIILPFWCHITCSNADESLNKLRNTNIYIRATSHGLKSQTYEFNSVQCFHFFEYRYRIHVWAQNGERVEKIFKRIPQAIAFDSFSIPYSIPSRTLQKLHKRIPPFFRCRSLNRDHRSRQFLICHVFSRISSPYSAI